MSIDMQCVLAKNATHFFGWTRFVFLGEWIVNNLLSIHLRKQPHAHTQTNKHTLQMFRWKTWYFYLVNVPRVATKKSGKVSLNIFWSLQFGWFFPLWLAMKMKKKKEFRTRSRMQTCKMSCVVHLLWLNCGCLQKEWKSERKFERKCEQMWYHTHNQTNQIQKYGTFSVDALICRLVQFCFFHFSKWQVVKIV